MTTGELLKPRFKVIQSFPFNKHFEIGKIIELPYIDDRGHLSKSERYAQLDCIEQPCTALNICFYETEFEKFPHLFKKLNWYEERAIEDLPKYVLNKSAIPEVIIPVTWILAEDTHNFKYEKQLFAVYRGKYYPYGLLPSTEKEYNEYINSKTETK